MGAQVALWGREQPAVDEGFSRVRRIELGRGAWVDLAPRWLSGHAQVFDELRRATTWHQRRREMYDRVVDVPRLTASLPDDGPVPAVVAEASRVLSHRYHRELERIMVACYRDGRDSVAWHGDRIGKKVSRAVVAIVAVGAPRRFLLRPAGGGPSRSFASGWGDLLVMGGTCQSTFEHTIPKVAHADPRISIMFRHAPPDDGGARPGGPADGAYSDGRKGSASAARRSRRRSDT